MKEPRRSDTFKKRPIEWLWHPFIQKGAINLLTGGPGTGKSTIACDIAAALSRARSLPGEAPEVAQQRGVRRTWLFNAEDDPEDTICWRLDNQGADRSQIWINSVDEAISFSVMTFITEYVRKNKIDLIVVDPVQAWIPAETDMHRANQMREWGNLFRKLCLETGVTVLWVRHRRKGDGDDAASINSGLGSIDMSGIVRSEIGAIATKKGSKIVRIKGSVGQTNLQLSYNIEGTGEPGNDHGQLHWSGAVQQPKYEEKARAPKANPMDNWIIGLLMNGPRPSKDIVDAATRLGYNEKTLYRRAKPLVSMEDGSWRLKTPAELDEQRTDDPETEAA